MSQLFVAMSAPQGDAPATGEYEMEDDLSNDEKALREHLVRSRINEVQKLTPLSRELARLDSEGFGSRLADELKRDFPSELSPILDRIRPKGAGRSDGDKPAGPDNSSLVLLRVFTDGISDDRIEKATPLLADDKLTANDKLTKIDALIPLPPTASAEQLGEMLGVTKQAVLKTDWWMRNRKGENESEVGLRRERHRERAKACEAPGQDDDE
jgi:hypothetical protein